MRKDLISIMDVLSSNAQGLSLAQIAAKTGVPKTSAKRILDTAKANNIDWATFCQMTPERQQEIFLPKRRTQMNYVEPDWENVYLQHERPRRRIALRILWEQYCQSVAEAQRRLGYSSFCKAYERYKDNLPVSLRDVSLSFQWEPGDVAMIDYSGDPLYYTTRDGAKHRAEIFVGVLPFSNYIFCLATKDQTRLSWLQGCRLMFEYFGAVPRYVYLDNSTSLVIKADRYTPQICNELKAFSAYYGFCPYPVRPAESRDKGAVEGAVKIVQQRITNRLAGMQFRSIEDVNESIQPLLEELNARRLTERLETRTQLHQEEVALMIPLPSLPYEFGLQEKTLKVRKDYQIRLNNRRFSVPYQYVGKNVRVLCWPHKNILRIYDVITGKQIAEHYYDPMGVRQNILTEHMPLNHLAMMRSKQDLLDMLAVFGPNSAELGRLVTRNQPVRIARRLLSSILASGHNMGAEVIENIASSVLKRPSPTFATYQQELDLRTGVDVKNKRINPTDHDKNIRGASYYANRLKLVKKQGDSHE